MASLVSDTQSALLANRFILDGPLVVNELVSWAKRSKSKSFLFKIDFEKAFDSLNWGFIDVVFMQMGFPVRWRNWMKDILNLSRASVLVNGSLTQEFQFSRGVRQGDPLSPYIFILAMEVLGDLFSKVVDTGNLCGIATPNAGAVVSHLIYTDDVLVLGEWSTNNFMNVIRILRCFYLISGLTMNPSKSKLFGLGGSTFETLRAVASINKVSMGELLFTYLGVPIRANMNKVKSWDDVIHTVENRLSKWKELSLSIGGRVILIKSVLNSLPMYFLSLFKAPKQVIAKLDAIRKRFLWGSMDEKRKIHWVSWDRVIAPKFSDGLRLDSIQDINDSMFVKWLWRFNTEDSKLWRRVIASIHAHDSSTNAFPTARFSRIWYNICQIPKIILNSKMVIHNGGCHCKNVRWRVDAPASIVAWQCNCSDCAMRGNTHFIVPSERFEILGDSEKFLTTYTFGTHTAKHTFCKVCGITSFYTPKSNPDGIAITYKCVDPGSITHVEIKHFDGLNWEISHKSTGIASCSKV
uniref:uncharacterized protein LOC122604565 n=1 Tax=Erigeron canadensis TaxID=72917 RepID=UPI001CB964BD|nr:uncharacterized protein LOC122604565 [Erigeron canadensis]